MENYKAIVVFVLGVLVLDVDNVHTCFCPKSHPQTDYCHLSSFVIVGFVKDVTENIHKRKFNVTIQHMLKVPEGYKGQTELQLMTYKGPSLCELTLSPGLSYLIAGSVNSDNDFLVNSCLWTDDFNALTLNQFNGLLGDYDCSCYINEHWGLVPPKATPRDICNYDQTTSCEHAACRRGEHGTCEWLLDCSGQREATPDVLTSLKRRINKELNDIL